MVLGVPLCKDFSGATDCKESGNYLITFSFVIFQQWTYILTSCFVMGGSVYCFFQSPSKRQFMYAPVTLIGIGMSITYVMSMAYTADLVKESTVSID